MSIVSKREAIKQTVQTPRADGEGYITETVDKFAWRCEGCGRVWPMRHQAVNCEGRGHVDIETRYYGGYVENGVHKGGRQFTNHCLRREAVPC